jgi:uncharacterized BrkB/YihY/UPF0761 family membrane protein
LNALLSFPYPVGGVVLAMSAVMFITIVLMTAINRVSPDVPTPVVVISLYLTLTFVTVTVYSTLKEIPETKTGELLLGALISGYTIVLTFWFGKGRGPPNNNP